MKILIIGGHLSPALSVIEGLNNDDIFYVGRKKALEGDNANSLEYITINAKKIPFYDISTARLQRKITKHTLSSLLKMPYGFIQAYKIVKSIKPDVVLGFGGYVSLPIALWASFLGIPVVIHEQTLEAGLANKILSHIAQKICISWESSGKFFPKEKTVLTGLPLRKEIFNVKKTMENKNSPTLFITGGSLGAHALNGLVVKGLKKLLEKYYVIHQTGDARNYKDYDLLNELKNNLGKNLGKRYEIRKFFDSTEMIKIMKNADIIISRSGINTVAELIYLGKPAFLIPLPFSQRNEQIKNANFAKSLGLCEVGDQNSLTTEAFLSTIDKISKNLSEYKIKNKLILNENAANNIISVLKNVVKKKKTN